MILSKEKINNFKTRLLSISGKEPLSKMSLVVILALDIFVVSMIFAGLSDHSALLTSPYEHMPSVCRTAIVEKSWVGEERIDQIQKLILAPENSYRYGTRDRLDPEEVNKTHPSCQQLLGSIRSIKGEKEVVQLFRNRKAAQQKRQKLNQAFKKSKDVYDTNLLENIAEKSENSAVPAISSRSRELSLQINELSQNLTGLTKSIETHPAVERFTEKLQQLQKDKPSIVSDIKRFDFWYPIKELAWQFLFLIPLCGLFYFWNKRSINNKSSLQILISSHLLVVSFIPVFFKILKLILDIIPHRILESLFNLLVSLRIIAIWHYVIILLAIILALVAIYLIQKKLFSSQKIMEKRLIKGACYSCGKKLPNLYQNCPFCGKNQLKNCSQCGEPTFIAAPFCIHCGKLHLPE